MLTLASAASKDNYKGIRVVLELLDDGGHAFLELREKILLF